MLTLPITDQVSVLLYDSIKDLPASRFVEAKQYGLLQAALSTTADELAARQDRMAMLLNYNQQADYQQEAFNYQLSLTLMEQGYNPLELEWACHIHSIDKQPLADISEEALIERIDWLKSQGLTTEQIENSSSTIHRQIEAETKRYYPNRIGRGHFNQIQRYIQYGKALANQLIDDTAENRAQLDQLTIALLGDQKPLNLREGPQNALVDIEKSYFRLMTTLQECGCADPSRLTVFEYYCWLDVLEERLEQQKAALQKPTKR